MPVSKPTLRQLVLAHRLLCLIGCSAGLLGGILFSECTIEPATAQVVRDRSLPTASRVQVQGDRIEITEGTRAGSNLFHSFERFSVPDGMTAFFNQAESVKNIFSRVTGSASSRIDGMLRANGSANLFLLNPNGVLFGPNAALNIGGSFMASSADRLRFADGTEFSAVRPEAAPLLTISRPIGLEFGPNPGDIQVQGSGHQLFLNSPTNPAVNRTNRPVGLQVAPGQTLALLGGDLALRGANLTATDGQIALGSIANGQVALSESGAGWQLGYDAITQFQNISLTQASSLETSGNRGGAIRLQGREIRVTGASAMLADTLGSGNGGLLDLQASEQIRVSGFRLLPDGPFVSRLSTDVAEGATGQGGNLSIVTPQLEIERGGQISSGTFGAGDAGTLQVQTETLLISGSSPVGPSGLFVPVEATASGNGGRLSVQTNLLRIDQAQIAASTFGVGNAGTLDIQATQVDLQRGGGIFAIVEQGSQGDGNRLDLATDHLQISGGSQITTLTAGAGNAGNISVNAREIEIAGGAGRFASGLSGSVEPGSTGRGGSITVTTERLQLRDGAEISTTSFGSGRAGNLSIQAETVEVSGGSNVGPSALFAAARGDGAGGNLTLNTERLHVTAGGQIATSTSGSGNAGELTLIASDSIELSGGNEFARSGLFASAVDGTDGTGTGTGGNLQITTARLIVQDGAVVSVSNFPSRGSDARPGRGGVGNLTVQADQIMLERQAFLTADSAAGDRGNLTLQANNILLRRSNITTNATGDARGGNINITTGLLAAAENADITANAEDNFGGRVSIDAATVLGSQVRPAPTADSDITASSALGAQFSGIVQLNAPEINPSQALVQLSERLVDASSQITTVCTQTEGNRFVVSGRGGLPEAPMQLLRGSAVWEDLRLPQLVGEAEHAPIAAPEMRQNLVTNQAANHLVEAQGWQTDEKGQVTLFAQAQPRTGVDCLETAQSQPEL